VKVRVGDEQLAQALSAIGSEDGDASKGLVFGPHSGLETWAETEQELLETFRLTQRAASTGAPVVYLLRARALLGREGPLDCAVATGLLSGVRTLAFEGSRRDQFAVAIALGEDTSAEQVRSTVEWALDTKPGSGQVLLLGSEHFSSAIP
jgi:hypothetical protein